ncbi:transmembrane transporter [Streptomyces viridochromogenes DSM 40736]|uniref:Transmembrane transporter n=2 Tax=Streptomyces viridochromogenes TaxID=1938 RepID=D9XF28_STRVT|nr:putative PhpN [Streptomyces viridochromogenes]EFL30507.1 transmembrane transporter [Streptomyces viridochromogenes DSM 40736]
MRDTGPAAPDAPPARPWRQLLSGGVGHTVESHDWYVYTFLAVYFADDMFPKSSGDPLVPLLNTFAVFAIAFAARPVGATVMGAYADRFGRRSALMVTILLMGLGSLLIALTPGYATVGPLAPALLVVARLVQGFSLGGEYGAAVSFLVESAAPRRRAFFGSFQYVASSAGHIMAGLSTLAAVQLSGDGMDDWGWRLPFAWGAVLSLVGLVIRRSAQETYRPEPDKGGGRARPGAFAALRDHPRQAAMVVGLTTGGTVAFYTWTTYLPAYATVNADADKESAVLAGTVSLIFFGLLQPLGGMLCDRVGRRPMMIAFGVTTAVLTVPLLTALSSSFWSVLVVQCAGMTLLTAYTSIAGAVNAELFPRALRGRGIGLPYAGSVALFGGTAPYVGTWLKSAGHGGLFPWYVAALCAVTALTATRLPRGARGVDHETADVTEILPRDSRPSR